MVVSVLWGLFAPAWADDVPTGAILRQADRVAIDADHFTLSPDGNQVLAFGTNRATLLAANGTVRASIGLEKITHAAVANNGTFVLVHDGGVTVHAADGAREQLRLGAFGRVNAVSIAPDGRHVALASSHALSVNDAIDGRASFSSDGEATAAAYDASSRLWILRDGVGIGFDANGRSAGPGGLPTPKGLLADGCVGGGDGTESICVSTSEAVLRSDGTVWALDDGDLVRWTLLGPEVQRLSGASAAPIAALAWASPTDLLTSRTDGHVERRGADGAVVADVLVPGCSPCVSAGLGGTAEGGFWVLGPSGAWQSWDAAGTQQLKRAKGTGQKAAVLLPDGRWVALGTDGRARIGPALGKGAATVAVAGAVGVDASEQLVAVWSEFELRLFDSAGKPRGAPTLGVGRKIRAVAVAPDSAKVAVVDDAGMLRVFAADGRPMYRVERTLEGGVLTWDGRGQALVAGGGPLHVYNGADGAELATVALAAAGTIDVAEVGPDGAIAIVQTVGEAQVLKRIAGDVVGSQASGSVADETPLE